MKHPANSIHAFSTWLLGITGTGMLLVPFHFTQAGTLSQWTLAILGTFCYLACLFNQIILILKTSPNRTLFFRSISALLLLGLTVFFTASGYIIEGCIFGFTGILQLILITPLKKQFAESDPLHLLFVFCGLSSGIYLALAGGEYVGVDISSGRKIMAVLFLAASIFEVLRKRFFPKHFGIILPRIQVIPWAVWGLVLLPTLSVMHLTAPGVLGLAIILKGFFPWGRLSLPPNDILGNRAVKITITVETALMIFLVTLLAVMDIMLRDKTMALISTRDAAFLFFILISIVMYYEVITIVMTVSGLMDELEHTGADEEALEFNPSLALWNKRLERYLKPFTHNRDDMQIRVSAQADQINLLSKQLNNEKKRSAQITLLLELSQQLEDQMDQPVASQLAANSLERALNCDMVCLFVNNPDQKEFMLLAAAGQQTSIIPVGYRQGASEGVLGRAVRQRKTQIINDVRADADYIRWENEKLLSVVVVPLIFNGHVNGALALGSETLSAFNSMDIWLAEAVAAKLTRAWERSRYHQHLMNLVQTGSQLSAMVQPETAVSEVASVARDVLQARFTFVHIHLGQERNFIRSASSGKAPRLLESLEGSESLIQLAFNAVQPFRVRDIRKYPPTAHLTMDHTGLRSMLAIPIRWHRLSIGIILAFGKQNEVFFNENDQSLAELLSIQAAGAFESTWLQQELRGSLRTTSLLYRLSNQIIQADNLQDAALDIAQTAHKIAKSTTTGIMLFDRAGGALAEVQVNADGAHAGLEHPMELISEVMESGQLIYLSQGNSLMRACLPILTPILKYGILWMDIPEDQGHKTVANPNDLQALVNQTAIALERSMLLVESRRQAAELKVAYNTLETTYDQTLAALMSALDARDRETEGHSSRVSNLTARLGRALNFSYEQLKVLERGSLLHDIGKIGISDTILHKPGPLSKEEWVIMRRHPDIGAKIVEGIPFLEDTIPLIRHHQEKWDGTGYPAGLRGEEIPILARMFSIVDAFDALTSKRPYRKQISPQEAVEHIRGEAGISFDPEIVRIFEKLVGENQDDFSE